MKKIFFLACLFASTMLVAQPKTLLRAYQQKDGGYVMLNAENAVVVINENGDVNHLSQGLLQFLKDNNMEVKVMPADAVPDMASLDDDYNEPVGPLLYDIMFNQSEPYNLETPIMSGKHCLTGCVATAMAQIMTYWKYPKVCKSVQRSYTSKTRGFELSYDYTGVTFDWDNILHNYAAQQSTLVQQQAVSKLMYACGVSVQMDYGLDGSGTQSQYVVDALVNVFGYKTGLRFEQKDSHLTTEQFISALIEEFDAGRPVYCSGSDNGGHAYVIDGYRTAKGLEQMTQFVLLHFNWGWGGQDNDWIMLNANTPYSTAMNMIRKIMPANNTAVGEVDQDNLSDGRIFDILGREVKETVAGQIYIQNGRKFIAR